MMIAELKPLIPDGKEDGRPLIIAGPCSAETEEQTLQTARALASGGIKVFRAGIWKPRTRPGGFEGVGAVGLKWLRKVKEVTGMLTATEVVTPDHVKAAVGEGVDILWIGARTSANPFAIEEIAEALNVEGADLPVLVKNPLNPDLELWIGALERLYNAGLRRLGAVHRGFSTYGAHLYRNPPRWSLPIELRRRVPQLPLLSDPSHIAGRSELVAPLAQQALDMDFDGLMIESHCSPSTALSDSSQQLTPAALLDMLARLRRRELRGTTESLDILRRRIDAVDSELIDVLCKRMNISKEIGLYKKEHGIPVFQVDRHDDVMRSRVKTAKELGLDEDFMKTILRAIHEESVRQQIAVGDGI